MTGHTEWCNSRKPMFLLTGCDCGWDHYRAGLLRAAEIARENCIYFFTGPCNPETTRVMGRTHPCEACSAMESIEAETNPKEREP